jgi:hypothetical protein
MNCEQTQETLLNSLTEPIRAEVHLLMEDHIASCQACRRFARVQRTIDARMTASVPAVSLSPAFRSSLRERLDHRQTSSWSDALPDIAHLVGCALGIVLLLLMLPQYSRVVIRAGLGFTVVTYFIQAVVRSSVERLEVDL